MSFDVEDVRGRYPILHTTVYGRPLVYLDNAATTQLSERTLRETVSQYSFYEANVHRGIHTLSQHSTARLERARKTAAAFLGAAESEEIVFTSGATAGINLVSESFRETFLRPGDEVITTVMEHHSNLIPWQEACRRAGAVCRVIPIDGRGELMLERLCGALSTRTKLVAVCAVSNVLGTVNPVREIIRAAHRAGAYVLIDGAQAVRHTAIDVQALDCDFFVFSGHKIMGPTGTGVLYGKRELLERMEPVCFGGGMVDTVWEDRASYGELPFRFEAGTPNIAGQIALGTALEEYLSFAEQARSHEAGLIAHTEACLSQIPGVRILGQPGTRAGAVSFTAEGAHPYDIAALLDKLGFAVRSGHHCAQPLLRSMGLTNCVRVSPAFYNTFAEIDALGEALRRVLQILGRAG